MDQVEQPARVFRPLKVAGVVLAIAVIINIIWFAVLPRLGVTGTGGPAVAWSREIPGCHRVDAEVHGDRIFVKRMNRTPDIISSYEDLICYDLDGKELWNYTGNINNYYVAESGRVYLGANRLTALDSDGQVLWETPEQKRSVVLIPWLEQDGYLYVRNGDPRHYIFDLAGNLLWEDDPEERVDNMFRAEVNGQGIVYLYRMGALRAIDPHQGELWRIPVQYAEPQLLTSGNLLSEYNGVASCYSPEGRLLWDYDITKQFPAGTYSGGSFTSTSCCASGTGVIYFSRFMGGLVALDEDGNELWRRNPGTGRFGGFGFLQAGPGGRAYCTESGRALCIDDQGNDVWSVGAGLQADICRITPDGHVMLRKMDLGLIPVSGGDTYIMVSPRGEELWTFTENGHFPQPEPVDGGRILVARAYDTGGKRVWPHDNPARVVIELLE